MKIFPKESLEKIWKESIEDLNKKSQAELIKNSSMGFFSFEKFMKEPLEEFRKKKSQKERFVERISGEISEETPVRFANYRRMNYQNNL